MKTRLLAFLTAVKAWIAYQFVLFHKQAEPVAVPSLERGWPPIPERLPPPPPPPPHVEESQETAPADVLPRHVQHPRQHHHRSPRPHEPAAQESVSAIWDFRSGILDRLDEYFTCMHWLKREDIDAYNLFARIGFMVPADKYRNPDHVENIRRFENTSKQSFGGILLGLSGRDTMKDKPDSIFPSFMYFTKMKTPSRVQKMAGEIYKFTALYDDRKRAADNLVHTCHSFIAVDRDGHLHLLKELIQSNASVTPLKNRRGKPRKSAPITLTSQQWKYPEWIKECATALGKAPEEWATGLFLLAFLTCQDCQQRIIVRTRYKGSVAAFGIDVKRAKVFFRDREATALATDGKRKRIFHSVIAHDRVIDESRTVQVRYHYRGIRHFDWNGYSVGIVMPTRNDIVTFDRPAVFSDDVPDFERDQMVGSAEVGEKFDEALSR